MKKSTRLNIFFNKVFNKMTPIKAIDKLEYAISKYNETLDDLNTKHSKSKALEKARKEELEEIVALSKKVKAIVEDKNNSASVITEGEQKLKELMTSYNMVKPQIGQQEIITQHLEQMIASVQKTATETQNKLTILKSQVEFAETVADLKTIKGFKSDIDLDALVKDIKIEFDASTFDLEKLDTTSGLDKVLENDTTLTDEFLELIK